MVEGFDDAVYTTAHGYPGGLAVLAARMKVNATVLSHKVNPNNDTHHLTVGELRKMLVFSGNLSALHAINLENGMMAMPLPAVGCDTTTEAITETCAEFADYLKSVTAAMADGKVTKLELRKVRKGLSDLISKAGALAAILAAKESGNARAR